MRSLEELFKENNLADPEDIDALLELAEITRRAISAERCRDIERLIEYTVRSDRLEAFSWVMAALQEEYDKADGCGLKDFTCCIGGAIANYDGFIRRLQVDLRAIDHEVETVVDPNGEVQSFFNILTYKTAYRSVFLISEENFDTKDNDFIRYKLRFTRQASSRAQSGASPVKSPQHRLGSDETTAQFHARHEDGRDIADEGYDHADLR